MSLRNNAGFVNQIVQFERLLRPEVPLLPHLGISIVRELWGLSEAEFSDAQLDNALKVAQFKPDRLAYVLYPPETN
jgi:hypothetical protein